MQDGGTGAGAQHSGAGREGNLIFLSCHRTSMWAPPVGGLFGFKFSSRPHPWKYGVKRFLVLRGVLARKWGWPVLGSLLGKNYRRRDRDRLVPPRWMDAAVSRLPRCAILPVGSTGDIAIETTRVHHAARWHRSSVAARGARAAERRDASD